MPTRLLLAFLLAAVGWMPLSPGAPAAPMADSTHVRVRILDRHTVRSMEVQLQEGTLQVRIPDTPPVLRVSAGQTASVGVRGAEVSLRRGKRGLYAPSLLLRPSGEATWTLKLENGTTRTYTGSLRLQPDPERAGALLLVNLVPLEDYVASVVASEYPFDDDLEGAKAMAVVARTYALRAAKKFEGAYDHVDHTLSQVYRGHRAVTGHARQAADATRGQVLTHDGTLIEAVYFSSSGGHTANHEDVWDADRVLPYLRGRPDPHDRPSPHHEWTTRIDRTTLLQALSDAKGFSVDGFLIADRSDEGRVRHVDLLRPDGSKHRMQANAFRLIVSRRVADARLKSTWFDARRRGTAYVFEGRGYGHGVGLSQWGAHIMAGNGADYQEILRFYYAGVRIERLDGVQVAPPVLPVANEQVDTPRRIGW
jgi:stage II sporulation protein D